MKEKKYNYYSLLSLLLIKYNLRLFIIIVVFVAKEKENNHCFLSYNIINF